MVNLKIDRAHSSVSFEVRHMGFAKVRGLFHEFDGTIDFDPENIAVSSTNVSINATSVDTNNDQRNDHLRSADFFTTDSTPTITFVSTRVVAKDDEEFKVHGDLSMNGVTRPVVLDVEYNGHGNSPMGSEVYSFSAKTKVNRKDYNINWNAAMETGGFLVSDDVKIELEIQANPA